MSQTLFSDAMEAIGGLSEPSKMPWFSWSVSAHDCTTGTKLRDVVGSVCEGCYAMKGYYRMPVVKAAHARRMAAWPKPGFVDAFVEVLTSKHERTRSTYLRDGTVVKENRFRWFDSGDLQSVGMLKKIAEIAQRTPAIEHVLFTKEAAIVAGFKRNYGAIPTNLFIKISHPMVGGRFDKKPLGGQVATVGRDLDTDVFQCPALRFQGNQCLNCRACWTDTSVNFPLH